MPQYRRFAGPPSVGRRGKAPRLLSGSLSPRPALPGPPGPHLSCFPPPPVIASIWPAPPPAPIPLEMQLPGCRPQGCKASAANRGDTWGYVGKGRGPTGPSYGTWANVAAPRVQRLAFPRSLAGRSTFASGPSWTPVLAWLLQEQLSRCQGELPLCPTHRRPLQVAQVWGREAWLEGTAGEKWGPARAHPGDHRRRLLGGRRAGQSWWQRRRDAGALDR